MFLQTLIVQELRNAPNRFGDIVHDRTARVWDAESGRPVAKLAPHFTAVFGAVFSPDGKRIATVSDDMLRLWDADSFQLLLRIRIRASAGLSVAFSPDGRQIVCGGTNSTILVWNAPFQE